MRHHRAAARAECANDSGRGLVVGDGLLPLVEAEVRAAPDCVGRERRAVGLAAHLAVTVGHAVERAVERPAHGAAKTASTDHRGISGIDGWFMGAQAHPSQARHQEVGEQREAGALALLGVELHREEPLAGDGGRELPAVLARAGDDRVVAGTHVVAVHEIEALGVVDAVPQRVVQPLTHPVPPHVRDLETSALGVDRIRGKADRAAREPPESRGVRVLLARLEQHLQAHADPEHRLRPQTRPHRAQESVCGELGHAVAHRALAREHDPVGVLDLPGVVRHPHDGPLGGDVLHRLGHRAKVAHAVVDHGDGLRSFGEASSRTDEASDRLRKGRHAVVDMGPRRRLRLRPTRPAASRSCLIRVP